MKDWANDPVLIKLKELEDARKSAPAGTASAAIKFMNLDGTIQEIVERWAQARCVTIEEFGRVIVNGIDMKLISAQNEFQLDYANAVCGVKGGDRYKDGIKQIAFTKFIEQLEEEKKVGLIELLKFQSENTLVETWLKACLKRDASEVEIAVLKHWMWMVKRKMKDHKTCDHIFPIFHGRQGVGKTEAIKKLIAPMKMFVWDANVADYADTRSAHQKEKRFVAMLDELERGEKTDIEALKRSISAEKIDARTLGTNTTSSVKNLCSPIGCTNRSVSEVLYDPTGMRRYFEFVIEGVEPMDWATINSLDYVLMWVGIDEAKEDGYIKPVKVQLTIEQKVYTEQQPIHEWWDTIPKESKELAFIATIDLIRHCNEWCLAHGYKYSYSDKRMNTHMKEAGNYQYTRQRGKDGAMKRGFMLPVDFITTINRQILNVTNED